MKKTEQTKKQHPFLGWTCILIGLYPLAIAFGYLNTDGASIHAPKWVIGLSGIVFMVAGCMILFRQHDRLVDLLAALICFSFAVIGIWVSVFSPSDGFSGGIPYASKELNIFLARGVFGLGAFITSFMCIYAIRRALR